MCLYKSFLIDYCYVSMVTVCCFSISYCYNPLITAYFCLNDSISRTGKITLVNSCYLAQWSTWEIFRLFDIKDTCFHMEGVSDLSYELCYCVCRKIISTIVIEKHIKVKDIDRENSDSHTPQSQKKKIKSIMNQNQIRRGSCLRMKIYGS